MDIYYTNNHMPSNDDWKQVWRNDIARLKREIKQAKQFITEAEEEIARLEALL